MPDSEARPLARPSLLAHGAPGVLATGLATLLVMLLLATLLWIVAANAVVCFWPSSISEIRLTDGGVILGEVVGREPSRSEGGGGLLVKIGNRELTGQDHLILDQSRIASRAHPPDAVTVARTRGGDAFGRIVGATDLDGAQVDPLDRERLRLLLSESADERDRLGDAAERLERERRPLTEAEHSLDRLRRAHRSRDGTSDAEVAEAESRYGAMRRRLAPVLDPIEHAIARHRQRLENAALELDAGSATIRVPMGEVEEVVWSNRLSTTQRVWHATRQAFLFLVSWPREANTEGGIYPALFGTVLMVLLMSIAVMPLGVLAAVYLYEYAAEGPLLRLADQAVNNLAGVPSIVFGMFGLAFFVYGVGGGMDRSFFGDDLPTPTFGTGGILWASLTLAVLTIPVVVVATREGLQAVPSGWRDGARALGATRLQTLRGIVLPAALPGILTGLILAVSRAAGEVAPLMLTGAVKLANGLPIDGEPPFLHLQRKFMHLSFHVYDVSMQSPNVEAAKPMAFASTLVLLALVVVVNLTAIVVRRRVRSTYRVLEG